MAYNINLGAWGSVFAVPSKLVDSHIKLASEAQLKVLLYILRNNSADNTVEKIALAVNVHEDEVKNAIDFWIERELIVDLGDMLSPATASENEPSQLNTEKNPLTATDASSTKIEEKTEATAEQKPRVISRSVRPDPVFVAQRLAQDKNLAQLMDDAQIALSKPLSGGDTATIVMLHDTDGLPCEVLELLINYCVSIGKGNMRTVERYGIAWSSEGIFSLEAAEQKIIQLSQSNDAWHEVARIFGIHNLGQPTKKQLEFANRWKNDWKFSDEMLLEAYERCVNTKGEYNLPYINGILSKWHEKSIFCLDALKANDEKNNKTKKTIKQKKSDAQNENASYDIDSYANMSLFDD